MEIEYTYEVVAVDEAAKCMEVRYEAVGRPTQHIGAPLPVEGETLSAVIATYAPLAYWRSQELKTVAVAVGVSGSSASLHTPTTLEEARGRKLMELAAARYAQECEGVTVFGVKYDSFREAQQQAVLTNALLQSGIINSVDWKASAATFVTHSPETFALVVAAIAEHVQYCFSAEKKLVSAVFTATTIAEVEQVAWQG